MRRLAVAWQRPCATRARPSWVTSGNLRPDQTTIAHCHSYTALRRSQGIQDGTIWTELGHLRTVGNWAMKRRLIAHAPVIERPARPAPKDRYLTAAEIKQSLRRRWPSIFGWRSS